MDENVLEANREERRKKTKYFLTLEIDTYMVDL